MQWTPDEYGGYIAEPDDDYWMTVGLDPSGTMVQWDLHLRTGLTFDDRNVVDFSCCPTLEQAKAEAEARWRKETE